MIKKGTGIIAPSIAFTILFLMFGVLVTSHPQFVYSQATDNEIPENSFDVLEQILSGQSEPQSNTSQTTNSAQNKELKKYENEILGIQLEYPSPEWIIDFSNNIITILPNNYFDKNKYSISISKIDLGQLSNMDNDTESLVTEYVNQYVDSDRYIVPGISDNPNKNDKLLNVNLSNNSIKGYEFFLLDKQSSLSSTITATTLNNILYTIEYKHPESLFDPTPRQKYLPIYEQVLNSIHLQ